MRMNEWGGPRKGKAGQIYLFIFPLANQRGGFLASGRFTITTAAEGHNFLFDLIFNFKL